ncbi:MBL fold metallo-hydrolase [Limibacillus sp. MBR-115]|jgi:ribonuclease Z|uniref:MBL fold metallo-hydrolase n=1 Tax=Limibacillus sp. MBR-115 TaxID=3156465 RepID=UPI003395704B
MELTLLGTGCPSAHLERYGPAALVRHAGQTILVDCGSGVTQRLIAAGSSGRDVDALFLTHLHSDHIVDLYQLIISSWHQGREWPQRIFGPPGTKRYVDGLMKLWEPERTLRIAHEERDSTEGLEVEVIELSPGDVHQFGRLSVEVVEVDHKPVRHAFGFIFAGGGRRLAISGDTRRCQTLIDAARGVDLLLHEVFIHYELPVIPGLRTERTVSNVASYHTLSSDVGKIAGEAGVGCLVLTHFVPPSCDRDAVLDQVKADFSGPVIVGEDLMSFDLQAGVLSYGQARMSFPLITRT